MAGIELYTQRKLSHRRTWTIAAIVLTLVFMIGGPLVTYFPAVATGFVTPGGGSDAPDPETGAEHWLFFTHGLATLTLNAPHSLNALSTPMLVALSAELQQIATSTQRVVILAAAGKNFCAGHDLKNAGRIDGLSEFTIFFRLVLPLVRPAMATVTCTDPSLNFLRPPAIIPPCAAS